jgi:hypothetical protein
MHYREITVACSEIYTKHINKLCVQNRGCLTLNLLVHKASTKLRGLIQLHVV